MLSFFRDDCKKISTCLIYIAIILLSTNCVTSRILRSPTDPRLVRNIDYLYPFSDIDYIISENTRVRNDSLSTIANDLVFKTLDNNKNVFKLADYYPIEDLARAKRLKKEIREIAELIIKYKNIHHIEYTPTLDSIFSSKGNRFCMVVYNFGFVRTKKNYRVQLANDIILSSISTGQILQYSFKSRSICLIIIFDTINKNIAFARFNTELASPVLRITYKDHFFKILKGYLFNR